MLKDDLLSQFDSRSLLGFSDLLTLAHLPIAVT